jgi:hypothetical protein
MIPQPGQHVKCFLRNGNIAEGLVESWGETIVLKALDDLSLMIIHDPKQDIMLTKVLLVPPEPTSQAQEISDKIKAKMAEEGQPEPDAHSLNVMTKAQLHIELADQERKIVADRLTDHHPAPMAPQRRTYGYPGFFKKPSK